MPDLWDTKAASGHDHPKEVRRKDHRGHLRPPLWRSAGRPDTGRPSCMVGLPERASTAPRQTTARSPSRAFRPTVHGTVVTGSDGWDSAQGG
jgi:hypothetical protein